MQTGAAAVTDGHGHGTHVSGINGALHNNLVGISGLATNISVRAFVRAFVRACVLAFVSVENSRCVGKRSAIATMQAATELCGCRSVHRACYSNFTATGTTLQLLACKAFGDDGSFLISNFVACFSWWV